MLTETQTLNRKKGVGASESATVMGLNRFMSPYELWLIKTGRKEPEDISDIPCVYWGCIHEDNIAKHYAKVMGCEVVPVPETLFHKDYKFLLCHLDRKVKDQSKVLECKFAMFAKDEWGPSGTDIVPLNYIIQVQHQLAVTGCDEADIAVLIGGWDFRIYNFKRDEELINRIIAEVSEFWACVENDTPPPLRDRRDAELAYPLADKDLKDIKEAPNILSTIEKIKTIRATAKALEHERTKLEDDLTLYIKDSEGIKMQDQLLVTWKPNARGSRILRILEK
jgi:putative phage-type endonuclease